MRRTLGRLFNVLGDTLDGGESLEGEKHWCIHRDPPSFEDQSPVVEVLRDRNQGYRPSGTICQRW